MSEKKNSYRTVTMEQMIRLMAIKKIINRKKKKKKTLGIDGRVFKSRFSKVLIDIFLLTGNKSSKSDEEEEKKMSFFFFFFSISLDILGSPGADNRLERLRDSANAGRDDNRVTDGPLGGLPSILFSHSVSQSLTTYVYGDNKTSRNERESWICCLQFIVCCVCM